MFHFLIASFSFYFLEEFSGYVDVNKVDCQTCQIAKFQALPFNINEVISQAPFDLVRSHIMK